MNEYYYKFSVKCPNDDASVEYSLTIKDTEMILVESIVAACALKDRAYHEDIADMLRERLSGSQEITAIHSGVTIITKR